MTTKLTIYDILGALVPGILLCCALYVLFDMDINAFQPGKIPDAFIVLALTAMSLFLGHVIQSISSLAEPVLNYTWGGRPSDRAFSSGLGDRYLPSDIGKRLLQLLKQQDGDELSERGAFLKAMSIAEADGKSRASQFNGSYAYHRSLVILLLTVTVLSFASKLWGRLSNTTCGQFSLILLVLVALSLLFWYRCKQRAYYYVREVICTAERILAGHQTNPTAQQESKP